jgi:CRISPR-associated DxTHG motif protein
MMFLAVKITARKAWPRSEFKIRRTRSARNTPLGVGRTFVACYAFAKVVATAGDAAIRTRAENGCLSDSPTLREGREVDTRLLIACASLGEGARIAHALQPFAAAGATSIRIQCIALEHACVLAARTQPDVALLDIQHGLRMLPLLAAASPSTRTLLLYEACSHLDILEAVRLGAVGCVARITPTALLAKSIRNAHSGGTWFGREALVKALRSQMTLHAQKCTEARALTHREEQILQLIGHGLSNKEIGRQLEISDQTVKTHLHRVYSKLHQSGRFKAFLAQPPSRAPATGLAQGS